MSLHLDTSSWSVFDFYSLMLRASQESNKYQFYSLLFDGIGSNPRSITLKSSSLTITLPMLFYIERVSVLDQPA
jgi:hypothetical protein